MEVGHHVSVDYCCQEMMRKIDNPYRRRPAPRSMVSGELSAGGEELHRIELGSERRAHLQNAVQHGSKQATIKQDTNSRHCRLRTTLAWI